jgi:predicted DNA binding CopG/RHH family protein
VLRYEWDEVKNRSNRAKHRVWFEEAQTVFDDPSPGSLQTMTIRQETRPMKKEYDFSKLKEVPNPYLGKKKPVGINLSPTVIDYFKKMADETQVPYQKLIDLYLLDCVKRQRRIRLTWAS